MRFGMIVGLLAFATSLWAAPGGRPAMAQSLSQTSKALMDALQQVARAPAAVPGRPPPE
jgi:hypothetical protein